MTFRERIDRAKWYLNVDHRIMILAVVMVVYGTLGIINAMDGIKVYGSMRYIAMLAGFLVMLALSVLVMLNNSVWSSVHRLTYCCMALGIAAVVQNIILALNSSNSSLMPIYVALAVVGAIIVYNALMYKYGYRHNAIRLVALFSIILVINFILFIINVYGNQMLSWMPRLAAMVTYALAISVFMSSEMKDEFIRTEFRRNMYEIEATLSNDADLLITPECLDILKGKGIEEWGGASGQIEAQKSFDLGTEKNAVRITVSKWKGEDHLRAVAASHSNKANSWGFGFDINYIAEDDGFVTVYGSDGVFVKFMKKYDVVEDTRLTRLRKKLP